MIISFIVEYLESVVPESKSIADAAKCEEKMVCSNEDNQISKGNEIIGDSNKFERELSRETFYVDLTSLSDTPVQLFQSN